MQKTLNKHRVLKQPYCKPLTSSGCFAGVLLDQSRFIDGPFRYYATRQYVM